MKTCRNRSLRTGRFVKRGTGTAVAACFNFSGRKPVAKKLSWTKSGEAARGRRAKGARCGCQGKSW